MVRSLCFCLLLSSVAVAGDPEEVIDLWPGTPPGPAREVGQERDTTGPDGRTVAGKPVVRLGDVSVPQIHVYRPSSEHQTGTSVVICPGGGFSILAWDLEGTEVAEWFNSIGVTAAVVKYRVPTRNVDPKWLQPTQDTQRAISILRSRADEWDLDPEKVGVLGFSAGGHTAARTALAPKRHYQAVDDADQNSCTPNAAMLIYAAYLSDKDNTVLTDGLEVKKTSPPMFLVHAFDDRVPAQGAMLLTMALKEAGVPSELHVYDTGGHGYGLRPVKENPVTTWPDRCQDWLNRIGWLKK